jgi:lysozyme
MIINLKQQLQRDEGTVLHVYLDSLGIPTAGTGHNLQSHGINLPVGTPITQTQADIWLKQDMQVACDNLHTHLPWTDSMDNVRCGVLQNMSFNMGIASLLSFKNTLSLVQAKNYLAASHEMLSSLWAKKEVAKAVLARQVGNRANRLSLQMSSGVWQ